MDRMIWAAWRAFWVGLGASAVLIAQSLSAPPPSATVAPPFPPPAGVDVDRSAAPVVAQKKPSLRARTLNVANKRPGDPS